MNTCMMLVFVEMYEIQGRTLLKKKSFICQCSEGDQAIVKFGKSLYTLLFYKNIFYKHIEAEICKILRIF